MGTGSGWTSPSPFSIKRSLDSTQAKTFPLDFLISIFSVCWLSEIKSLFFANNSSPQLLGLSCSKQCGSLDSVRTGMGQ